MNALSFLHGNNDGNKYKLESWVVTREIPLINVIVSGDTNDDGRIDFEMLARIMTAR